MRSGRVMRLALGAACVVSASLLAQQRFTSTTSLLTLDVSVLDRDGNPVADLGPTDFVVSLSGETRPVRTMVFLATRLARTKATGGSDDFTPPLPSSPAPANQANESDPRLFVIMVDDLSIYLTESRGLLAAAERFVHSIPPRDWVGLATTSRIGIVNPSLDRSALRAELKKVFGRMDDPRRQGLIYVGLMEALLVDNGSEASLRQLIQDRCQLPVSYLSKNLGQVLSENKCASDVQRQARYTATFARTNARNQLDSYVATIKAMASAPGVKQLVLLSGGVPVAPGDSVDFIPVAKAAAAAGVQITFMVEEPDDADLSFQGTAARELAKDQRQVIQQMETLADMSGGQFSRVIGQADRFFQRVLTSASAIYRIGVDLPKSVPPDGNYKVAVTVKRAGARVLASRYAAPPVPTAALTPEAQMTRAITSGESLYAMPVQMAIDVVPAKASSPAGIRVSIDVPGDVTGPVSGILGVLGPDHVLRTSRHELARSGDGKMYILDLLVPATSGTYDLRFAVADSSGVVGAVARTIVVKAP